MELLLKDLLKAYAAEEPVRLNKYLSDAGVCSRREADRLIEAGDVQVDGKTAALGQKVTAGQKVSVKGKAVEPEQRKVFLAFHKPVGVECTTAEENPDNIIRYINYPVRIFPIGRLDKNSSGLILLTNVGAISDKILRGSNYHEKEYQVTVDRLITEEFLQQMKSGVEIQLEDGARKVMTRPCEAWQTGKRSFHIILTQGLNRQIRRMCSALGYEVTELKRIRIMNILLGDLPEGKYRELSGPELETLIQTLFASETKET